MAARAGALIAPAKVLLGGCVSRQVDVCFLDGQRFAVQFHSSQLRQLFALPNSFKELEDQLRDQVHC